MQKPGKSGSIRTGAERRQRAVNPERIIKTEKEAGIQKNFLRILPLLTYRSEKVIRRLFPACFMNSFAACGIADGSCGQRQAGAAEAPPRGRAGRPPSLLQGSSPAQTRCQADTRQVDQKIVAAKLNFRHEVELEPLKLAVQELTRRTLAVEHQNRVLQQLF